VLLRGLGDCGTLSELNGAIEGTRTPTPLRVRGPEPRASANSATMAIWFGQSLRATDQVRTIFYRGGAVCQTPLGFGLFSGSGIFGCPQNSQETSRIALWTRDPIVV
jgi:hypothetical protein